MSDKSSIEWTDATWNPVTGCTKVSPGCDHCYAERVTERFHGKGSFANVVLHPDRLDQPLKWRTPRRVFVNSMSDLFHDQVPDDYIADVFGVMGHATQHSFQILTKRHARMRSLLSSPKFTDAVVERLIRDDRQARERFVRTRWPLANVWLGVSVEDQHWADIRIPALIETPAAVRFLSCEPLLDQLDLARHLWVRRNWADMGTRRIDWVIVGGESGPGARPMDPEWVRVLRDQCDEAGAAFFFKQWGGVRPKAGGRDLDGRTWDEMPAKLS